jgi:toxin ParE1/3/4
MPLEIQITRNAAIDLERIHDYLSEAEGRAAADYVVRRILEVGRTLAEHPLRGTHPRELLAMGNREFRQAYFKPYRVIYKVLGNRVVIVLIADGRRDMKALLNQRLLSSE